MVRAEPCWENRDDCEECDKSRGKVLQHNSTQYAPGRRHTEHFKQQPGSAAGTIQPCTSLGTLTSTHSCMYIKGTLKGEPKQLKTTNTKIEWKLQGEWPRYISKAS